MMVCGWRCIFPVLIAAFLLSGCAAERLNSEGRELIDGGQYEEGVAKLEEAAKREPSTLRYRTDYLNKREQSINRLLLEAEMDRASGKVDEAEKRLRRVLSIDAKNVRATNGLIELAQSRHHQELVEEARGLFDKGDVEGAWLRLRQVASEDPGNAQMLVLRREIEERQAKDAFYTPTLKSLYKKPVTLEFRDANLKQVFDVLSRTSGINFVFDREVRSDLTTTIFVKRATLEDVVDLLLTTSQLDKKVLSSNSVLIYPNTPEKIREYQELVVKSFYLENADAKQTAMLLRTLLKTRDIFIDEKLNLMVMRDSPETIRLAEKMVALHDLAEPEVMLEVEVLEVTRTRLLDLGIKYPNQLTLSPLAAGSALTLKDLKNLGSSRVGATTGSLVLNAANDDSDVNLLANPRIRARNREKAKIMIGDRVPVITTTSSATGFVSDSVQYVDVGLKLEVEPNIYLKDEVAIKVAMEVSSIVNQVKSANGTLTYQIGSRNASTVLRLRDGETQVLAGLINDSDRASANKIPGLGDLPVLGRLFSSHRNDKQKTEIVLSITPHLVRRLERPSAGASEFWSGSETNLRLSPLTLKSSKPFDTGAAKSQPATSSVVPDEGAGTDDTGKTKEALSKVSLGWEGPKAVKAGENFKLNLKLKSDGGLRSLPFQVAYDAAVLKVVEVSEGDFFKQDNGQTNFASNIDVSSGKIFVGVTRSGAGGAAGDHTLATITFKSLADSPKTDVKLLTATPVGVGNKVMNAELPDPYSIVVGK
jgi:general secretion pathway protein D